MPSARTRLTPLALLLAALPAAGCTVTGHPVAPADLGTPRSEADLLAVLEEPGPLTVETVPSADWAVDRGGLVNLKDAKAKAAGLADVPEPIQIYFHAVRHPTRGTFLVDTGVERALRDAPDRAALRGLPARFMHLERLTVRRPLGDWLAAEPAPVRAVLLTHLHLDHVTGMPDLPGGTPLYAGPGEATTRGFLNLFVRGSTDRALDGKGPLRPWPFRPLSSPAPRGEGSAGTGPLPERREAARRFDGVVDVLGDGTLWALLLPGHTPGSTAYLARTPAGPVLLAGDVCHTRWGWENGVEPGTFSGDADAAKASFEKLRAFAAEHPRMQVRLGHQP
jgi:glyoxylase-like metal-dependent hydrolase (beta-lactamase superfamily II)